MIATSLPGGGAPRTVAFLASTLGAGSAERVLHDLALGLDRRRWHPVVFTLRGRGDLGDRIARKGIEVREGFLRRRADLGVVLRLARAFRAEGTAVLYTLDHEGAVLWGRLAARLAGVRASVTGLSSVRMRGRRRSLSRWNRWTLPLADRLLCAARGQADLLVGEEGADPGRLVVIPSAVDTEAFRPGAEDLDFRRGIGVPSEAPLAGVFAPLEPENALDLFLRAALFARARVPSARFLLVGDGPARPWLEAQAEQFGLGESVRF
ncbi:MAG: glycosyltransferase, partial [Planctomycetota bacterium]